MRKRLLNKRAVLGAALLLMGGSCSRHLSPAAALRSAEPVYRTDTLSFIDPLSHRLIPVRLYEPVGAQPGKLKVALLNHGYHGTNSDYSFIARDLVAHGYLVASLQQELPGDAPLATTGDLYAARRPVWEGGVQNMLVVLRELRRTRPALTFRHTLLLGHSNGGDMVMLFAREHPKLVEKVVSLDNRRMPLPRRSRPQVLSLRSSDQVADPGVLPTPAEQLALGMRIVQLPATIHNDMWDGATAAQQREMSSYINEFLGR